MSLVICSNLESDSNISARNSSIYKPFSFRNALSSTMTIPKNSQVALQSCKINLDGTVTIGEDNRVFYQYLGDYLTGATGSEIKDTMSYPVRGTLFDKERGVKEVQVEQLAEEIQKALNNSMYSVLYHGGITVDVFRDNTTHEFKGFTYTYTQSLAKLDVYPQMINSWYKSVRDGGTTNYTYDNATGTLTTSSHTPARKSYANVTGIDTPISPNKGEVIFDCSNVMNTTGGANQAVNFMVGLSCGSNTPFNTRNFNPVNYRWNRGTEYRKGATAGGASAAITTLVKNMFEVCIGVGGDGTLRIYHTPVKSGVADGPVTTRNLVDNPTITEFAYYNAAVAGDLSSGSRYNAATNADDIEKFKFILDGETIKIVGIKTDTTELTIYEYDATRNKIYNIKPMSQNTWGVQPFMAIQTSAANFNRSIVIEKCERVNLAALSGFDFRKEGAGKCGWVQQSEYDGRFSEVNELTKREGNDYSVGPNDVNVYAYQLTNNAAPHEVEGAKPVLILQESSLYSPSRFANTHKLFGFEDSPYVDAGWTPPAAPSDALFTINSNTVPRLLSTKSIFVRLENFTQSSMNARQGNRSTIIAHLPRFDGQVETGRLFFEPKNMIYLDLNNPEPLHINSFDISFVYSNEQFAESIVGQSIVVLHFKEKTIQ